MSTNAPFGFPGDAYLPEEGDSGIHGTGAGPRTRTMLDLSGHHPDSLTGLWILGHRRTGRFSTRRGRTRVRAVV